MPTKLNMVYIALNISQNYLFPKATYNLCSPIIIYRPPRIQHWPYPPHSLWKPLLLYLWNNLPVHICASSKYISELLIPKKQPTTRVLRSSSTAHLEFNTGPIPRTRYGNRSFSIFGTICPFTSVHPLNWTHLKPL